MNLCCKCRRKPLHNEIVKRTHYVIGIPVSHELTGPIDAHVTRWPNPEKGSVIWHGKPPSLDEAARWRTYDLNKELANNLG
jgi:hypothetical protein